MFYSRDIILKKDTLLISTGSNKVYRNWYYYIKKEVPKDWLEWESDIK